MMTSNGWTINTLKHLIKSSKARSCMDTEAVQLRSPKTDHCRNPLWVNDRHALEPNQVKCTLSLHLFCCNLASSCLPKYALSQFDRSRDSRSTITPHGSHGAILLRTSIFVFLKAFSFAISILQVLTRAVSRAQILQRHVQAEEM